MAASCGGDDSGTAPTSTTATTTTEATTPTTTAADTTTTTLVAAPVVDQAFLDEQAAEVNVGSSGAFMVVVADASGDVIYSGKGADHDGNPPTPEATFRVGSITKVFTSLVTLTLVDEGLVELDAPAGDYVTRVPVPAGVVVRDLLQHTTGIPNYTEASGFFEDLFAEPEQVWSPEEAVDLVAGVDPLFEPGATFSYSNTNFAVLGVLIEEVTGEPFHEVLRARILDPLALNSTYLAGFEEGPEPYGAYFIPGFGIPIEPLEFDYTSIATSAWAAGSLVSSAQDLHTLFTALFADRVISASSLAEMTGSEEYGFGLEVWSTSGLFGHGGGIPGYLTLVLHSPETGRTAFWASTADYIDSSPAIQPVATAIGAPAN